PSAISEVGDCFAQNHRKLQDWQFCLREGRLPVARGLVRTTDDRLRAEIISTIMCNGELRYRAFEVEYEFSFKSYFAQSLERLEVLAGDGLIEWIDRGFRATDRGLLFLRAIAMAFDAYIKRDGEAQGQRFSRIV
ncbi:MAG: coproporphyrinogen III oxidase, partial [Xanthomonadaceae bacterium]|nr:coproporphyrinogen III oxidase [Xanthomonadaceae bacterium]